MAQTINVPGPFKGGRRIGDSTLSLDQMSIRDERYLFAPAVRRNAKLDSLLGISDTSCPVQAQQKKSLGMRLRKKSSNSGAKTSRDPPLHALQRLKLQNEGQRTRGSSPVLGRYDVLGSFPSSMSSSTYSLDKPTSRDFFDHLNGRHDSSNPSSPTSYGESIVQKRSPIVIQPAHHMPGLTLAPQEARYQNGRQGDSHKTYHLGLSRFIPKICRPKRSATPSSETINHGKGSPIHPRNGTDWRHVAIKAQESDGEDKSPPRVLRLPRSAKPMKSTEEMQKWLDESRVADRPDRENTPAISNDPHSQLPSPTFSEPSSEQSTSTASVQTLTSQKPTRISRRLKEHIMLPEDPIPKSKAARAHDKCVAWNLVPNNHDSRDLQHESMLSISSSDDESRTSRDFGSSSKPSRCIVNFSKPRLSRTPSANPSPEKARSQRVELFQTQQDSFHSTEIGSPNPWYWSGVKQTGVAFDHCLHSPPRARRKSIPNVIGEMESRTGISVDLAIDAGPGRQSPLRRFMAVTKHEERLLEAMRVKRASMRVESTAEDDATVWSQKLESSRPKTSGGLIRSPTILHGTDVSSFPSPPKLGSATFSRSTQSNKLRPELRPDLMQRSYLASIHSIDSPLVMASENKTGTHSTTHFDALPPDYLHSPVSEVSPTTPTAERMPVEVMTAKGVGVRSDKTSGGDRVSKISSRISLKSGEGGELVSSIEERERDGDGSEDEEDLVIWAMEVSVR